MSVFTKNIDVSSHTLVQQSDLQPHKRIKLNNKSKLTVTSYLIRLENANSSSDALEILCDIGDAIQYDAFGISEIHIRKLFDCYRKEKQSVFIKIKILSLLGDLFCDFSSGGSLIDELLILLNYEESQKVLSHGLCIIMKIGKHLQLEESQRLKVLALAKLKLVSINHNVQRHALLVLGTFQGPHIDTEFLELISKYTESQDARVRAQAFNSLLLLCSSGHPFPIVNFYGRATKSLKDDYEIVRQCALLFVYEISLKSPETKLSIEDSDQQIRLIDDAFSKVCNALYDLSLHIRVQAAQLLGRMENVGNEFLHQTLDKKLMSNMRRKKSFHERNYEHFTSGEWSTGKKWADDAPKEILKAESVFLMSSGACGAFVQGLEDEFLEVRAASIESMCQLAMRNKSFAITCLDFLVDMFNDEIEAVRLKAIYSLISISNHIVLREDQLEIMLSSLEDYSVEVREGLHLMLGSCKVSTQSCLMLVVNKVLDVLSKYPQDISSAYKCLKSVGQMVPHLCMSLTPQLLQDHPFFDTERDVEEPAYVCILIMLFNAAQHLPSMVSLFPDTTMKHYSYLRDTMPDLVPKLKTIGQSELLNLTVETGSKQFLETLLHNVLASSSAPSARRALLEAAQDNLARLAAIDPSLFGTANFTAEFLGAQLLMEQIQTSITSSNNRSPPKECMNRLLKKCLKLQNLFSNLTMLDMLNVKEICLRASALQLIVTVKDKSQSALAPCQVLLHNAENTSCFLKENSDLSPDVFTTTILDKITSLADPKPGRVYREILSIVQNSSSVSIPIINTNIQMCKATIIEPKESNLEENIIKMTSGLIAQISFVVEIENLQEHQIPHLRIKVKYPDQNILNTVPKRKDLKKVSIDSLKHFWRLRTQVLLSHAIWTEPAQVSISLCLAVRKPNQELELCKPTKVILFPKPVKRGI